MKWGVLLKTQKLKDFSPEKIIGGPKATIKKDNQEYNIEVKGDAECSVACPAGVNVKAYVNLIKNKKYEEAIEVIREANPFPAVCGRVCTRPCEASCELSESGDSIPIRALKRYASDYELARRPISIEPCKKVYDEKVVIIGAGPAGLTAGVDLIRMGYSVTVFERSNEPGGMLRYAIPPYRLPDRVLKREIDWIKKLGVEIKTDSKIENPVSLFKKGYSAVLIAGGAPKSFPLGIPGEKTKGVIDALDFLRDINERKKKQISGTVVVIGGGSTAFDAARSAVRLGANKSILAYRRGIEEMPAEKEEIDAAKEEGVEILTLSIPNKIVEKKGQVIGIKFLKAKLGKPDKSGRRSPIPIKNSEFLIKADNIIPAVGAMPDVGSVGGIKVTTPKGVIDVKEHGKTVVKGVFAAGDVEMGPSSVVEAIGRGHEAAKGINAYLRKIAPTETEEMLKSIQISLGSCVCSNAKYTPKREINKNKVKTFEEVEKTFTDFEAVEEASRCFSCGPCYACPTCLPNCKNKQLVAEIKDTTFLVKSPMVLSKKIYEEGPIDFKLKSDKEIKNIKLFSLTSKVNADLCIGCGRCEEVCAYRAIKNIISKDKKTVSQVSHEACASCSACVSECPSGAVTQGYMSDDEILKRLNKTKTPFSGVKGLMSYWSTTSPLFNSYDGIVELMSARKPSPSFLIRALARSGRGLVVIKPDKVTGSHYLPWEEAPDKVVKRTWNILKSVGISPDRIKYVYMSKDKNPTKILKEFSKELDNKKLGDLKLVIPKNIQSPVGEAMVILRIISANPDTKTKDNFILSRPAKKEENAIFEGCLPMLHLIGKAHRFYDIKPSRVAIRKILDEFKINAGFIEGFNCPSKGLLDLRTKGIKEIVDKIEENNKKVFKNLNPKKLMLCTPESYSSFSKDKNYENVSSFLEEILKKIEKSKGLKPVNKTVAIHHACKMNSDQFYEPAKKILKKIPGIKIVEIKDKCGHNSFDSLDSKSKQTAISLIKKASKKGADTIVCTSPYCLSHLLLCFREGSWTVSDIEISDVFQILYSSITGDI